jgi:NitT/TauT family transport system substrate-binding protein
MVSVFDSRSREEMMLARIGILLLLILAALVSLPTAEAGDLQNVKLLVNYTLFGRHAPLFLGIEKGFYKEDNFEVEILPSTGSGFVNTAIDAGKADYALTDASVLVKSIAKGAHIKAFGAFMDVSANGLASLQPIPTPNSLIGKTIAAAITDSSRVVLPIIYSQKGLDASRLQWQAADPSTYFSLLLSGRVDVIAAAMDADRPALTKAATAQRKQVSFAAFADWGYDSYGLFLITQSDRIAKRPDQVKAFLAATKKSVEYAFVHPEEAAHAMVNANSTMNYDLVLAQWKAAAVAMQTPFVKAHGYGAVTTDRLRHTIQLARTALKIDQEISPSQIFADNFLTH